MKKEKSSRRKKPRFKLKIYISYQEKQEWQECFLGDINLEGAGILFDRPLYSTETFKIKIEQDNQAYIFKVKKINSNQNRIGIKFIDLNSKDQEILSRIINTFSSRFKL